MRSKANTVQSPQSVCQSKADTQQSLLSLECFALDTVWRTRHEQFCRCEELRPTRTACHSRLVRKYKDDLFVILHVPARVVFGFCDDNGFFQIEVRSIRIGRCHRDIDKGFGSSEGACCWAAVGFSL